MNLYWCTSNIASNDIYIIKSICGIFMDLWIGKQDCRNTGKMLNKIQIYHPMSHISQFVHLLLPLSRSWNLLFLILGGLLFLPSMCWGITGAEWTALDKVRWSRHGQGSCHGRFGTHGWFQSSCEIYKTKCKIIRVWTYAHFSERIYSSETLQPKIKRDKICCFTPIKRHAICVEYYIDHTF